MSRESSLQAGTPGYVYLGVISAALGGIGSFAAFLVWRPNIAVLVAAAVVLLAAIIALWNSVRSLTGDLDLADSWVQLSAESRGAGGLEEQKRAVLRALKDLESEYAIGKIDAEDYALLSQRYRDEAKAILRKLDTAVEAYREEAEALAMLHLRERGIERSAQPEASISATTTVATTAAPASADIRASSAAPTASASTPPTPAESPIQAPVPEASAAAARRACATCSTSNEPDAKFCKSCGATFEQGAMA
jgi:hypothetical protein